MIQNFAAIGYDSNNMHLATYELSKRTEKKKTVIVSHSMGSLVALYLFKWVESPLGGNGGKNWVNDHVESFVNIGGPLLGLPKALSALLSGEMRDRIGSIWNLGFKKILKSAELFRTWDGLFSMLPKGGDTIWGNVTNAPDDRDGLIESYGPILNLRSIKGNNSNNNSSNDIDLSENNETFTVRVPLLSLGFMCTKGWNNPLYNPAKIKVITREFELKTFLLIVKIELVTINCSRLRFLVIINNNSNDNNNNNNSNKKKATTPSRILKRLQNLRFKKKLLI
ncbi:hypothetical protein Glove_680g72 [Diversispora epigaea]|uniref:Uncharacterized protein n=1 Tax=Diversispora epigaea TaxID=1348612 RepID=A0A397G2X4_9GLOM|nr:hypothetical protein Glove_680g72 [Diversispora epigaea]